MFTCIAASRTGDSALDDQIIKLKKDKKEELQNNFINVLVFFSYILVPLWKSVLCDITNGNDDLMSVCAVAFVFNLCQTYRDYERKPQSTASINGTDNPL